MNKTRLRKIAALLFALAGTHVIAGNPIETANNQATVEVGYLPTQIKSNAVIDNSRYLKGHDLSLGVSFTKLFLQRIYTQFSLNAEAGNQSYGRDTFLTTATSVVQTGALRVGYFFLPNAVVAFTPYITLGYRYWQLDIGGHYFHGNIRNGSSKFYQNGFYGLGLLSQFAITQRMVLNADLLLGKTINPWLRYDAPDVPNEIIGRSIIYQSAFTGPQPFYQAGLGVDYAISNQFHANAGVQYQHMQFGSAVSNPSHILQPHLSIAQWNYHAGVGVNLDSDPGDFLNSTRESDVIIRANNQASLWYGYIFQNYGETIPGSQYYFDREVKNIPAVNMVITKTFQHLYSQFNLMFAGGTTQYKSTSGVNNTSGSPATNYATRNALINTNIKIGYTLFPCDNTAITPYLTGGYHRWLRDLAGSPDEGFEVGGYAETYQYAAYALGLLAQYSPGSNWVLNIDGNAGTMENASNVSWGPQIGHDSYQAVLTLKQRFIYNLGVGGDYQFAKNWHLLMQLNYLYFKFGRSANKYLPDESWWYEPNSTTRQFSMMAGIGYQLD